jgi:hypothetical protein
MTRDWTKSEVDGYVGEHSKSSAIMLRHILNQSQPSLSRAQIDSRIPEERAIIRKRTELPGL